MKKNLLHISGNMYSPFKEHHTRAIWNELSKGFDNYYLLVRNKKNKFEIEKYNNITIYYLPKITNSSKSYIFSSNIIYFLIKKNNITNLLSQCPIIGINATIASKIFNIPLLTEIHGEEYFYWLENNKFLKKIIMFSFNNSNKIRSLNHLMTNKLLKYVPKSKIVEIPNRVNLKIFNKPKENFKINEPIKLISVGRFVKEKNYLNLIKTLHMSGINFELKLIGGGNLKNDYLKYIKENNLENKIILLDNMKQQDLIKHIINSDIYIQSSISEGMPRAILEAMALRMPIISTNVGSILGVLKDNYNSLIIKPTLEDLKEKLLLLIKNENLRKKIAFNAYENVLKNYEWNKIFNDYVNSIKNL